MKTKNKNIKYIFILGGVVSSIGKGIIASSIGALLKGRGYKVFIQKFDPYLNVDPGTMNPKQHGEVFVTYDGAETDLDLGHYERFLDQELTRNSNFTAGKIFQEILKRERDGYYLGSTIQYIPHVINLIKEKIVIANEQKDFDFIITEIGGTVGDLELQAFLEAIRQFKIEKGNQNVCNILVSLVPFLDVVGEFKTKPSQNAIKELSSAGINPDIFIARSTSELKQDDLNKLSMFTGLPRNRVFNVINIPFKYKCPIYLHNINLDKEICTYFNCKKTDIDINKWTLFNEKYLKANESIEIAVVGKYISLLDSYISLYESLNFSGWEFGKNINIQWIDSEKINKDNVNDILKNTKGIIVPGGFGERGIAGKICAIKYARENNIPFLGLCLGFQLAVIEYATNVLKMNNVGSTEFNNDLKNPIIDIINGKKKNKNLGGSLRLGNYACEIEEKSLAHQIYGAKNINERHRHRYEFNNAYLKNFLNYPCSFSGFNPDTNLKEIFEIKNHPFFIATQYHPEFQSRPNNPHPLFKNFVKKIIDNCYT